MAVWLTKKGEVILIGDRVYTGDTNPCGYAYIQKCTYKEGTTTSDPTITTELLAVQVDNFCTYTNATEWFNKNSGTYPTSGAKSHTLLNSQLAGTESAAGWLTCADEGSIKLDTCSYDPEIYYVHGKCTANNPANPEAGVFSCIISTSDTVDADYTVHKGPYTYDKAIDEYYLLSGSLCSTGADYNFVVMSDGCDCFNTPARHKTIIQSYAVGSPAPSGTKLAGPFDTYAKAAEAANKSYSCSCAWYFGWNTCKSLCGDHNAGETINYAVYGPFTYNPTGLYEKAAGPYSSYTEAWEAMAEKEKITCKCSGSATKWYLYKKCSNNKYTTTYNTTGTTPSGYTLHGSYDTYDQLRAAQSSVEGTSCGSSGNVWISAVLSFTTTAGTDLYTVKVTSSRPSDACCSFEVSRAVANCVYDNWGGYEDCEYTCDFISYYIGVCGSSKSATYLLDTPDDLQ